MPRGSIARRIAFVVCLAVPATQAGAQTAFGADDAIDESALGKIAGREDLSLHAQANQTSVVSNNSVSGNSVTGAVQIDGQAFQNLQGLSVINANSGNNVSINAAMNVTIAITAVP